MVGVESDGTYDGIPFDRLLISTVVCTEERAVHLKTRSQRKAAAREIDIESSWAIEAVFDSKALVDDGHSRSGLTIRVTGWSPSARRVIAVTLYSDEHPPTGVWYLVTAWAVTNKKEAGHE